MGDVQNPETIKPTQAPVVESAGQYVETDIHTQTTGVAPAGDELNKVITEAREIEAAAPTPAGEAALVHASNTPNLTVVPEIESQKYEHIKEKRIKDLMDKEEVKDAA